MAKRYVAPETAPTTNVKNTLPLDESNGTVLVKFYFNGTNVPPGIPAGEQRDAFPTTSRGVRQGDTGVIVIDRQNVSAQLLRTDRKSVV